MFVDFFGSPFVSWLETLEKLLTSAGSSIQENAVDSVILSTRGIFDEELHGEVVRHFVLLALAQLDGLRARGGLHYSQPCPEGGVVWVVEQVAQR